MAGKMRIDMDCLKVRDYLEFIDGFAPFETADDFDNVGLIVGDPQDVVKKS